MFLIYNPVMIVQKVVSLYKNLFAKNFAMINIKVLFGNYKNAQEKIKAKIKIGLIRLKIIKMLILKKTVKTINFDYNSNNM